MVGRGIPLVVLDHHLGGSSGVSFPPGLRPDLEVGTVVQVLGLDAERRPGRVVRGSDEGVEIIFTD